MATKTFYLLNTAAATPNFFGNLQEGGTAPTAGNSSYGWTVAKGAITSPYWRGRYGASAVVASGNGLASSWIASNNPTKGTGATNTTAGDSFISPVTYAGTFANTNWTFSFNMRAGTAGAVGRIRLNVYRSANADGTSATKLTSTVQVGSTITLSTTADNNSSITWSPGGTITLANEYLFIQPEWEETTAGSSTSSNVLFRIGTASFTTSDYTATTATAFSNDWTTGTPSIPANMAFSRASTRRYFNSSGVLSSASINTARFNYKWDGSNWTLTGLLVEDQRTNSCYNSDLTAWSNPGAGNTVTATTGLDGTSDAYLVVPSTGFGSHMTYLPGTSLTTANPVTYSCYVTASGYTKVAIRECVGSGTGYNFDLASGGSVIGSFNSNSNLAVSNPTIDAVGSGGVFRITFRITPTGSQSLGIGCIVVDNSFTSGDPWGSYTFAGNGTSGAIFDTPQLEEGLNASSSIRTAGSGVAVSADILSSTDLASTLNLAYIIETQDAPAGVAATVLGINTIVGLGYDTSNHLTTADGGTQTTSATRNIGTPNGCGIAFDSTPRVSISLNGSAVTTAANTPVAVTALYFGCTNNGASGFLNGHIRKANGYTSLTDSALANNTGNSRNAVVAQNLGALTQALTGTVIDAATVAQTLGALGQSSAATHPDTAAVAQTLGALVQTATSSLLAQATTTQTLGALGQAATATNLDHAVVAQTLGALSQVATGTVADAITVAQNLGALTQTAAATHPDTAAVAQTLGALVQAATAGAVDTATAAQTLGALSQAATLEHIRAIAVDQTLGALAQAATATAIDTATVAQTLGALGQAAAATHPDSATVAQNLGALTQAAAAGVVDTAAAAQTLGAIVQTATAGAVDTATAAQTLGALAQAAAATAPLAIAASQTLGNLAQTATGTVRDAAVVAQTLGALAQTTTAGVVDAAAVSQALGALVQAAAATVVSPSSLSATQTLGALGQALTGTVVDTATVAQALGPLGQSVAVTHADTATTAQTLGAIVQALTGAAIDTAAVSQALGALNQTATAATTTGFIAAQTLGALVQALTGKVVDAATVAQALGGLSQTATGGPVARIGAYTDTLPALGQTATGVHVSFATVSQVLGALAQTATASVPNANFAAAQILGALGQVATSSVANRAQAIQILGALTQASAARSTPPVHIHINGRLEARLRLSGSLASRPAIQGKIGTRPAIQGRLE